MYSDGYILAVLFVSGLTCLLHKYCVVHLSLEADQIRAKDVNIELLLRLGLF